MLLSSTTPAEEQEDRWSLDGVFGGFGWCHLNKSCSKWPIRGPQNPLKPHQDAPVLHNSSWGGIRTGGVLMGVLKVLAGVTKIKVAPNDLLGVVRTLWNPIRMLLSSTTPSGEQEDKWSLDGVFGGFGWCHQNKSCSKWPIRALTACSWLLSNQCTVMQWSKALVFKWNCNSAVCSYYSH